MYVFFIFILTFSVKFLYNKVFEESSRKALFVTNKGLVFYFFVNLIEV